MDMVFCVSMFSSTLHNHGVAWLEYRGNEIKY